MGLIRRFRRWRLGRFGWFLSSATINGYTKGYHVILTHTLMGHISVISLDPRTGRADAERLVADLNRALDELAQQSTALLYRKRHWMDNSAQGDTWLLELP